MPVIPVDIAYHRMILTKNDGKRFPHKSSAERLYISINWELFIDVLLAMSTVIAIKFADISATVGTSVEDASKYKSNEKSNTNESNLF